MKINRPRVAAIGLDADQTNSIEHLCGDLRTADSIEEYLARHSLTETDVVVSGAFNDDRIVGDVHLLTIGQVSFSWLSHNDPNLGPPSQRSVRTITTNTERELTVPSFCPELYKSLALDLAGQLMEALNPPPIAVPPLEEEEDGMNLIQTTSDYPVAMRLVLSNPFQPLFFSRPEPILLVLPTVSNLPAWLGAFLADIHAIDPERVPEKPSRMGLMPDWHTPQEWALAERISKVTQEIARLSEERNCLQTQLAAEGEKADKGIRRIIWADGDDLATAVTEVLTELGFTVKNMDEELEPNEPKREDLRLTLEGNPNWEALVEVKGYLNGTRTNDSRQIREHREKYIAEKRQTPDLTLWLANPFRERDPSSRPARDSNVNEAAANIGAVHVLATDLYQQWVLVKTGRLDAQAVVRHLTDAEPGLWTPLAISE